MRSLRAAYGAGPLHLLALLGCFALTGYVLAQLAGNPSLPRMLVWFAGAIVAHDLIAFPVYAGLDRLLGRLVPIGRRAPALVNHVRVPAAGSVLLLVVYLPGIIRQGSATYSAATGQTQQPFLERWLLITAVMFGVSAAIYLLRLGRRRWRDQP